MGKVMLYTALGNIPRARQNLEKALRLATEQGNTVLAQVVQRQLDDFPPP